MFPRFETKPTRDAWQIGIVSVIALARSLSSTGVHGRGDTPCIKQKADPDRDCLLFYSESALLVGFEINTDLVCIALRRCCIPWQ